MRTRGLIVSATVFNAILAGTSLDRVVVQMPAWHVVGVASWAAYSRHADLGNGLLLYPTVAVAGCILSVAAAMGYARSHTPRQSGSMSEYFAAVLTILGLLLTMKAAPFMLSLRSVGADPIAVRQAFDGFEWWGNLRAFVQVAAFAANLWSLVKPSLH